MHSPLIFTIPSFLFFISNVVLCLYMVLAYYAPNYKCLSANDLARLHQSKVPIPENEAERIFALRQTELLDSDRDDPMFDRFTALAQRLFDVPIALVSLVDIKRQWYIIIIHQHTLSHTI